MSLDFNKKYKEKVASAFVLAWIDGGPVEAGRVMREMLPEEVTGDLDALKEFRPYINKEFLAHGYTFDDEES